MDYDKLLEKYEHMKTAAEKYQKKYKSFKDGYIKVQKKLGVISKQNQELKEKLESNEKQNKKEMMKYKGIVQKYKKMGLDFTTKKKVLELQQTVTNQEEKLFKLKEKLKGQKIYIQTQKDNTKMMRQENINIKNVLNNIQLQINHYLPSSRDSSKCEEDKIQPIILKQKEEPINKTLIKKHVEEIKKQKEEPKIIIETLKEESDYNSDIVSETEEITEDEETEDEESESEIDAGFLSD